MKILCISALASLFAASISGQGTVDFRNGGVTFPTTADRNVYSGGAGGTIKLSGTNYVAGLWFAPDSSALGGFGGTQAGAFFRFRPSTSAAIGTWNPGLVSPLFGLPGVDPGQTTMLQVRVFDNLKFASFQDALVAGEYGVSSPFRYTVPMSGSTPDKYYMDNLRAFVVPEPRVVVLWVIGALGLLAVRRRR